MSDTPRTDVNEYTAYQHLGQVVPVSFARKLERELAAVTKERDELAICHDTQRDRADAYMEMSDKLKSELAAVTAERDGLQRSYDVALRQMNEAIAKAEWLRTDRVAELERELAEVTAERDALKAEIEDIKNATLAAMDESCDCNERHCSCVPLLRAEVKRLTKERDHSLAAMTAERDATIKLADDLAETLSDLWHHYSLTGAGYEVVESALAMWKEFTVADLPPFPNP